MSGIALILQVGKLIYITKHASKWQRRCCRDAGERSLCNNCVHEDEPQSSKSIAGRPCAACSPSPGEDLITGSWSGAGRGPRKKQGGWHGSCCLVLTQAKWALYPWEAMCSTGRIPDLELDQHVGFWVLYLFFGLNKVITAFWKCFLTHKMKVHIDYPYYLKKSIIHKQAQQNRSSDFKKKL